MRVSKWVDFGQEVDVEIDFHDVRAALAEAFGRITEDRLGEEGPNRQDVANAINLIGTFLKALTDEQIALLTEAQRSIITRFLSDHAQRFAVGGLFIANRQHTASGQGPGMNSNAEEKA